ncbi:hypothetical protein [Ollibium composti]|uniref:Uncharacterized protein n=1 Tax=Ollibium composti TaxID=2675109 RepID=A0ABY2Q3H2_9HYPH|nr:hypothetical protein [Mesorhizobium composti]THF55652.1 hypothetical protein E6C48_16340 [Mesorhizobium composti]
MVKDKTQFSKLMVEISNYFHFSNIQSTIAFDVSSSTWNRIKANKFKGILSKDQELRCIYIKIMINAVKDSNFKNKWIHEYTIFTPQIRTPFEIIQDSGLAGMAMLVLHLKNPNFKSFWDTRGDLSKRM